MQLITKKYNHLISICYNTPEYVRLNYSIDYNIHTVYFINCLLNDNYFSWLRNHIDKVYNFSNYIYIECIANLDQRTIINTFLKKYKNIQINYYNFNEYEYRGIKKVYDLGKIYNSDKDIILYFHSKGITKYETYFETINFDYNNLLNDINRVKEIFDIFPKINKVGLMSSQPGWIWYNFWFARGSYIFDMLEPLISGNRHYYEEWLHLNNNIIKYDCYSIIPSYYLDYRCPNIKSYYEPDNKLFIYKNKNMFKYEHN